MPNGWSSYKKGGKGGKGGDFHSKEVSRAMERYLQPLLLNGIQRTLAESSNGLSDRLSTVSDNKLSFTFKVSTKVDNADVTLSLADGSEGALVKASAECDKAIVDLARARKTIVFGNIAADCVVIFNSAGEQIRQLPTASAALDVAHPVVKWLYASPILESSSDFASNEVLGIMKVETNDAGGYHAFTDKVFQNEVNRLSSEVGPYLAVLNSLSQIEAR